MTEDAIPLEVQKEKCAGCGNNNLWRYHRRRGKDRLYQCQKCGNIPNEADCKRFIYRQVAKQGIDFYDLWEHEFRRIYSERELNMMMEAYQNVSDQNGYK